uniref:DUF4806 domain-containing protein n=1 Tax=Macrostomum lignano TaxID=282301 RepID=A0A1I8FWN2_9PLAT
MMSSSDSDQEEPSMPALTYALVLFAADRSFDLVLKTWFKSPTTVLWPPRRAYEKAIDGRIAPDENWTLHEVIVLAQHDCTATITCFEHPPWAQQQQFSYISYYRTMWDFISSCCGNAIISWRCGSVIICWRCGNAIISWRCGSVIISWRCGNAIISWRCGNAIISWRCGNIITSHHQNRNRSALPSAVSSPGLRNSPSVELSPFAAANTQSLLVTLGDLYGEQPDVASPGQSSTVTLAEVASMISKIEASQRATYLKVCSIDRRLQSIEQHISSNPLPAAHSAADSRQHQIPTDKAILGGLPFNSPEGLLAWSRQVKEDRKSTETVFAFLRRLGGKSVSTQVSTLMYQLMTDGLAKQYSLRGAVRRDVVWTAHKTATGLAIEEAVGEHLRFAAVRERRKAERASSGQNAADSGVGPRLDGEGDAEGFGADDADEEDNY